MITQISKDSLILVIVQRLLIQRLEIELKIISASVFSLQKLNKYEMIRQGILHLLCASLYSKQKVVGLSSIFMNSYRSDTLICLSRSYKILINLKMPKNFLKKFFRE